MALVGVIALVGMDVRNSVVLMVQIDAEIAEDRDPWDAVVAATTASLPPHPADRVSRGSRHAPHRVDGVLGTVRRCRHRRVGGGNLDDLDIPSGPICSLVPRKGAIAAARELARDRPVGSCAFAVADNV